MTEAEWIAFLQRPEIPAFNRAMLANPEDDLPRLVFADWLDEHCPDGAVNKAVRASIANPTPRPKWPRGVKGDRTHLLFNRGRVMAGVPESRRVPANRPPRKLFEAMWRALWVEVVSFGRMGNEILWQWLYDPATEALTRVWLHAQDLTSVNLSALLGSPHLVRLTSLVIHGGSRIDWFSALAVTPVLTRLEELKVIECDLRDDGFLALVTSAHLSGLKVLSLPGCTLSEVGVVSLANSPHLRGLERLELFEERVSPPGAAALANSSYLCEAIRAQWR